MDYSNRPMRDAYDYEYLFAEFMEVLYNLEIVPETVTFDILQVHDLMHKFVSPVIWL
jgi:hypothetical protein